MPDFLRLFSVFQIKTVLFKNLLKHDLCVCKHKKSYICMLVNYLQLFNMLFFRNKNHFKNIYISN